MLPDAFPDAELAPARAVLADMTQHRPAAVITAAHLVCLHTTDAAELAEARRAWQDFQTAKEMPNVPHAF